MKTCSLCKEIKAVDAFNKHSTRSDGLQPFCRECMRAKAKDYYSVNKDKQRKMITDKNKERRTRNQDFVVAYLKDHPCVDCGTTDIRVLEFDHRPGVKKVDGVAGIARNGLGLDKLLAEINKCDVRCRNCHTIKTYERLGGSWHDKYLEVIE